ncbi:hypothetical protein SAMN03159313_4962 [Pseudomonas sp. NFIX46]|nr:hypothetical protein SAMN03159313_4962 [Pseudomonas sp. NFIX46]SDB48201.1 hypothetical protein SAMN03097715_03642 [Pseudomonas putida]
MEFLLENLILPLGIVPFTLQDITLLLELLNLGLPLHQQKVQVSQARFGRLTPGNCF